MFTGTLFEQVLVSPVVRGANKICIVSGYATPALVYNHFQATVEELRLPLTVQLIYGMAGRDGVPVSSHELFKKLSRYVYPGNFECWYMKEPPPVHAKTYAWLADEHPQVGFVGSANYTQAGFRHHREVVSNDNAEEMLAYFNLLLPDCVNCLDRNVEDDITFTTGATQIGRLASHRNQLAAGQLDANLQVEELPPSVHISLLDRYGDLPQRSGLNWGQRPEYRRDPDQAYIRVPIEIARATFFPPRGVHFTLTTDDGQSFDAVIAQAGEKAIETPKDNSILGRYFRLRVGVVPGAPLTVGDLRRYGRTDLDFVKIDEETYFMDFSVNG